MPRVVNSQTKMKLQMHKGILFGLCFLTLSASAQIDSASALTLLGSFEVPRSEKVESILQTSTGSPLMFSTEPDAIIIRPIDMTTGLPTKLLTLRSNSTKKIKQHTLRGDSLFCLVRSTEDQEGASFESVVYSLRNDALAEVHRKAIGFKEIDSKRNIQPIFFTASAKGKYALVCRQQPYSRESKASIDAEVTKHPEGKTQRFTLPFPFESDDIEILGVSIDDKGIISIGAKAGVKLNSPFLRKFLVYSFNPLTKELHEFDLSVDKIFMQDMLLKPGIDNLQIVSLYSTDPFKQAESMGYTFVQVDSSGSDVSKKLVHRFTPEITAKIQGGTDKSLDAINGLFLNDIYTVNGHVIAVLDRRYQDQVCTTDPRSGIMTCTDQFHFDGILVENLSIPSLSTVIERRQIDYNSAGPYMGMQSYNLGNRILILYNDHTKNQTTESERIMNNPSRSALRYVVVDSNGDRSSHLLSSNRGNEFLFMAAMSGFAQKNDVVLLFSNGKEFKVGRLDSTQF